MFVLSIDGNRFLGHSGKKELNIVKTENEARKFPSKESMNKVLMNWEIAKINNLGYVLNVIDLEN